MTRPLAFYETMFCQPVMMPGLPQLALRLIVRSTSTVLPNAFRLSSKQYKTSQPRTQASLKS